MTTVISLQNHKIQQALIIMSDKSRKNRLTFCHTFSIQFIHIHTHKHIYNHAGYAETYMQFNK